MGLDIIRGNISDRAISNKLIDVLQQFHAEKGSLYIGYPIISSSDSNVTVEALLISIKYGLVAFCFYVNSETEKEINDKQDHHFYLLEGHLKKNDSLREGRVLAVKPCVITYFPSANEIPQNDNLQYLYAYEKTLKDILDKHTQFDEKYYNVLESTIQKVTTIKPRKKRENVKKESSKGSILKQIEKKIANLDSWQKKAAIENPEGPQRIRGLAGSGKTIVLALKAAYLYSEHPDWNIAITYNTRALHDQFVDLIERFTFEHIGDKPDWKKLQILPAWGSASEPGIYSSICDLVNLVPYNFVSAKSRYGSKDSFEGICKELLSVIKNMPDKDKQIYDCILIDEAQDLPVSFFQIIYEITKEQKRIVWAYDELQNLTDKSMLTVEELFGLDNNGKAKVSVLNNSNEPQKDIILPICYRNTHWALVLAHSLGFGIYRNEGLVQFFDAFQTWDEIGYETIKGHLNFDSDVTLKRRLNSYPGYFETLLKAEDAIVTKRFENYIEEYAWVAKEINKNLLEDELERDDILIIFSNAITAQNDFIEFRKYISQYNIPVHLAGVTTDRDTFFKSDSVTATSIYRAKGNEAAMVYILNADYCENGFEMIKLRNTLFTAITRSKAWVRISGVGYGMENLQMEINKTINDFNFNLSFHIPTKSELEKIKKINRDRSSEELKELQKLEQSMKKMREFIETENIDPSKMPELKKLLDLISKEKF